MIQGKQGVPLRSGRGGRRFKSCHSDQNLAHFGEAHPTVSPTVCGLHQSIALAHATPAQSPTKIKPTSECAGAALLAAEASCTLAMMSEAETQTSASSRTSAVELGAHFDDPTLLYNKPLTLFGRWLGARLREQSGVDRSI
jgi:hypothetical protein